MGSVYHATDTRLDCGVAIKLLPGYAFRIAGTRASNSSFAVADFATPLRISSWKSQ